MAIGMVCIRRFFRQLETNEGNDGTDRIRQVIHSIGCDGHRTGEQTHGQFATKE